MQMNTTPVMFLALANVAHYNLLLLHRETKTSLPNARCRNEIKGKNYWVTIDYMTDYAIKEYRLLNMCYE